MNQKSTYDRFLMKKLKNLREEMEKIEGRISLYNDTSLLGETR